MVRPSKLIIYENPKILDAGCSRNGFVIDFYIKIEAVIRLAMALVALQAVGSCPLGSCPLGGYHDTGRNYVGGTQGVRSLIFSDGWDIICHVLPHVFFRFFI